ncbi:MAG TPA: LuxR family transcriptional regulator [Methylocystis sp.]|nr:LuxR family transcriptional regulator [Methylocystis sp.]
MNVEELFDKIKSSSFRREDNAILKDIADFYGFAHMNYLGLYLGATTSREGPLYLSTYPEDWQDHYLRMGYFKKDPTIKHGLESLLPFDWTTIQQRTPLTKKIFEEAREFGISDYGLSFPIRGYNGEIALITMTGYFNPSDWQRFKQENVGNLLMIAIHLHLMVMDSLEQKLERPALSPREIETLSWASQGKTCKDVAEILRISERTVRFYMENARHKLDALSVSHAVARAISMRIIPPSL